MGRGRGGHRPHVSKNGTCSPTQICFSTCWRFKCRLFIAYYYSRGCTKISALKHAVLISATIQHWSERNVIDVTCQNLWRWSQDLLRQLQTSNQQRDQLVALNMSAPLNSQGPIWMLTSLENLTSKLFYPKPRPFGVTGIRPISHQTATSRRFTPRALRP